jgi:hypothetical protein
MTASASLSFRPDTPLVVAIDMGYGHMRAAEPLSNVLETPLLHADRPPLADEEEQKLWARVRRGYEWISRSSQIPIVGRPLKAALDAITAIPPMYPVRDLSGPTLGTKAFARFAEQGLGRGLVAHMKQTGAPLVTTFYSPAILCDRLGADGINCVVTDSDINRVWAPFDPPRTKIRYFAPSVRAKKRLESYGVPAARIELTGFPLPHELLGGEELTALRRNLTARLGRLDPGRTFLDQAGPELARVLGEKPESDGRAPLVTFAVGGAGSQVGIGRQLIHGMASAIRAGKLRLALIAGVRPEVDAAFRQTVAAAGLTEFLGRGVEILHEREVLVYMRRFHALLAETDVLWTKPSEMTFFAALGLPLVCAPPVGRHEDYNRQWAVEQGAGLHQGDPRVAAEWLLEWVAQGTLAAAAWAGFRRLPQRGLYNIIGLLRAG